MCTSYHAMSGDFVPHTLRFVGSINNTLASILIDSRNTHNFVQSRIVEHLGLIITLVLKCNVMIGNG